ncbi:MAG: hypothetical protein ACR2P6_02655, partial [Gammaproteobacteria bacterium]
MAFRLSFFAVLTVLVTGAANAQFHDPRALAADPGRAEEPIAPKLDGLGDYHFKVSTRNKESQYFFDQGLRLTYAFNHSEALRAFKEAARLDPNNAMAYWGWALTLGPNINLPMQREVKVQAYLAMQKAKSRRDRVSARERAYINALAKRYSASPSEEQSKLDQAYADAMFRVSQLYPKDADARTLHAAALMNLSPWNYWSGDGTPYLNTGILLGQLDAALEIDPEHPGALHYYIHAVEAQRPYMAEEVADRLDNLMPGAGHMVHMPSHIYMRVGRYSDAYRVNALATRADEKYIAQCKAQGIYPVGYYPHNQHFLVWSAWFLGRSDDAMQAARKIQIRIPVILGVDGKNPTDIEADGWEVFEDFMNQPSYTMVRFGWWDKVLAEPKPPEQARFMNGIWHYARGLAYAHKGKERRAEDELEALQAIIAEPGMDTYPVSVNGILPPLNIAAAVLAGEIAASEEDYATALLHLGRATRLQDGLFYMEPPNWYFPVRHVLGAVLLEAGYPDEAETVYWADLRENPDNGFALFGLWKSYEARNMKDAAA